MGDNQLVVYGSEMNADKYRIPVAEIFGPTIQGEGRYTGIPCYFIRVGGCDYRCNWCDSMHAVEPSAVRQLPRMNEHQMVEELLKLPKGPKWVVISGGNPLLYDLSHLVQELHGLDFQVMIETQGSRWKEWAMEVDHITISPKGPSAALSLGQYNFQVPHIQDFKAQWWDSHIRPTVDLKVPIFDRHDFLFAKTLHQIIGWPMYLSVGNYTQVDGVETLLAKYRQIIAWTIEEPGMADVRVTPQMHVLLWGNKKGV